MIHSYNHTVGMYLANYLVWFPVQYSLLKHVKGYFNLCLKISAERKYDTLWGNLFYCESTSFTKRKFFLMSSLILFPCCFNQLEPIGSASALQSNRKQLHSLFLMTTLEIWLLSYLFFGLLWISTSSSFNHSSQHLISSPLSTLVVF